MVRTLTLSLSFLLCFCGNLFAYPAVYNPETGAQDYVGVGTSSDVSLVCDAGNSLVSAGAGSWACSAATPGSGDVNGPAGATSGNFATFADATGKVIADSGVSPSSFSTNASLDATYLKKVSADATYLLLNNANQASWSPSTTVVTNLNADQLDGNHASAFVTTASADVTYLKIASADLTYLQDAPNNGTTYGRKNAAWSAITGGGSVNSVNGDAPIVSSGGTDPYISMASADTSTPGYLLSADWNTFNNKLSTASADVTYLKMASADLTYLKLHAKADTAGNADTVTTNANLTGPITSVGNATSISTAVVTEDKMLLADTTSQDASTVRHGFLKKLDNSATSFMNGQGNWAIPAGGGITTISGDNSVTTSGTPVTLTGAGGITTSVAGDTVTINGSGITASFDSTAVDSTTWSDGSNASNVWTFDVSGTDTTMTMESGDVAFSHAITTGLDSIINGITVGQGNNSGSSNTAIGYESLFSNAGSYNTAIGNSSLYSNSSGVSNVAIGYRSMYSNLNGQKNVAIGEQALSLNTNGGNNTAIGYASLLDNVGGTYNTAIGSSSLSNNTSGIGNVALGGESLVANTTGQYNTGAGMYSLTSNTEGTGNVGNGYSTLQNNTTGDNNTAVGGVALYTNRVGDGNVAIGNFAGYYETSSDAFYVNNQNRTNTAGDKSSSLMYGHFATNVNDQTLAINAKLSTPYQITSSLATGTAPFSVASTTPVTNLSIGGNAATVTTNANLTGPITSVGNVTSISTAVVTEDKLLLIDSTSQDATTVRHGFLKKLDNDPTHYIDGQGNWTVPSGGGLTTASADATYVPYNGAISNVNLNSKSLTVPRIKASADSVTAIQIFKADGVTRVASIDTSTSTIGVATGIRVGGGGVLGTVNFGGSTSGNVTIQPQAVAGSAITVTLPNASGTVAVSATSPIALSATTGAITHVSTAGNKHVPTGGSSNQILKNSGSSGTGAWGTVTESSGALANVTTIGMSGQLTSAVPSTTAPFVTTSDTVVVNLNADKLDGNHAAAFVTTSSADATYLAKFGGTMTGNITQGESTSIILASSPLSADGKWSGITESGIARVNIVFGDIVFLEPLSGRWDLANATAPATSRGKLGVCVLAANAGNATKVLLFGKVNAAANFPTLTSGDAVYIAKTSGDVVVAQPATTDDVVRIVGFGNNADELAFQPSDDYMTHV